MMSVTVPGRGRERVHLVAVVVEDRHFRQHLDERGGDRATEAVGQTVRGGALLGALHQLELRENQFHASEVTIAAAKLGLRVREVPCTFRARIEGSSKKPPFLRYGYGYTRTLLRTWLS